MALTSRIVASGRGWRVLDVQCDAGPGDRPFEECHADACIAVVTDGYFHYRTRAGAALLVPGAVMLGNNGACFECGHEHSRGDRCLSFKLAPDFVEGVAADIRGVRSTTFAVPRLAPTAALTPIIGAAEAARECADKHEFEELAVRLTASVLAAQHDRHVAPPTKPRDTQRVSEVLRWMESDPDDSVTLERLSGLACMSRYHFLRTFRMVAGVTPHQYLLRRRFAKACAELRRSRNSIASIAAGAGFGDLSTFNRQFHRIVGMTPGAYRKQSGAEALGRRGEFIKKQI